MSVNASCYLSQISQNQADNTSVVRLTINISVSGTSYNNNSQTGRCWIDGTEYSFSYTLPQNTTRTITFDKTIGHDADGTKWIEASFSAPTTPAGGTKTGYASFTLTPIPRHATITNVTGTITDDNFSPTITWDRKGAGTVYVACKYKDPNKWNNDDADIKSWGAVGGTSLNATLTTSEINAIRNNLTKSQTATIRFFIYSTVGGTTSYSSIDKTFTIINKPPSIGAVSITNSDTALSNKFSSTFLIKNYSKPKAVITATGQYGATISKYETTIEGKTYMGQTITATEFLMYASTSSISVKATDSRGFSTTKSVAITVNDYTLPNATLTAFRCNSSGAEQEDGTYIKFVYSGSITPLGNNNNKTFTLQYRQQGTSSWTSVNITPSGTNFTLNSNSIISGFSPDNAYEAQIVVADYFNTTTRITAISTSFSLTDWKANGKGVAFGKASTLDGFEIGQKMPLHIYANTTNSANVPYCTYRKSDGTIGATITTGENGNGLNLNGVPLSSVDKGTITSLNVITYATEGRYLVSFLGNATQAPTGLSQTTTYFGILDVKNANLATPDQTKGAYMTLHIPSLGRTWERYYGINGANSFSSWVSRGSRILYNSSTGTTGNITTASADPTTFDYIDLDYKYTRDGNSLSGTWTIPVYISPTSSLSYMHNNTTGSIHISSTTVTITSTGLTRGNNAYGNLNHGGGIDISTGNLCAIYRMTGR